MTTTSQMPMSVWYATEGGRKCPMCGKYAKADDLGNLSFPIADASGAVVGRVSRYGHKPGTGCNRGEE